MYVSPQFALCNSSQSCASIVPLTEKADEGKGMKFSFCF